MKTVPALFFAIAMLAVPTARGQEITLAADGAARMPILTADTNHPAARELQAVLGRISGAAFDIAPGGPGTNGIHVGKASDFPWLGLDDAVADLGPEGCLVRSDGANLLLLGLGDKGARHAVATFLHELGCRWFFPGDTWEVLPRTETIRGAWNLKQVPSFNIQRHLGYGFGSYPVNGSDKQAWDARNRLGGSIPVSIGHAGHGLTTNDFERTPELFAMRGGKRVFGSKPCYSHPEFVRRSTERVLREAAAGRAMIPMTPADGLGYCECPLCHEWAQGGEVVWDKGSQFATRPDGKLVTVYYFNDKADPVQQGGGVRHIAATLWDV